MSESTARCQSPQRPKVVLEAHPGNLLSSLITASTSFVQIFSSYSNSQNMLQQYNTHICKLYIIFMIFDFFFSRKGKKHNRPMKRRRKQRSLKGKGGSLKNANVSSSSNGETESSQSSDLSDLPSDSDDNYSPSSDDNSSLSSTASSTKSGTKRKKILKTSVEV